MKLCEDITTASWDLQKFIKVVLSVNEMHKQRPLLSLLYKFESDILETMTERIYDKVRCSKGKLTFKK